jgi:hypothetical protein
MRARGLNAYGHKQAEKIVSAEGLIVDSPFEDTRAALDILTRGFKADLGDGSDVLSQVAVTRDNIKVENILADTDTGGQGVVSPEERLAFAQALLEQHGRKAAMRYLRGFGPTPFGKLQCPRWELVPPTVREEIRETIASGAATPEEVCATYHLTTEAFQGVMDEIREPETVPVVAAEAPPEPVKHKANNASPEHMARMREARARKEHERAVELERLRTQANSLVQQDVATVVQKQTEEGPAWTVTILKPSEVTVHATTLAQAMVLATGLYGEESVVGIVRA